MNNLNVSEMYDDLYRDMQHDYGYEFENLSEDYIFYSIISDISDVLNMSLSDVENLINKEGKKDE